MSVVRKIPCEVKQLDNHGDGVYTVELRPRFPLPRFKPGQFLHLALDAYDPSEVWPESRAFSIASSPEERGLLRMCYSVKGTFTRRMEKELVEGREVWVKLPYGDLVIEPAPGVVLFAGGTGISAFTAFIGGLSSFHNGCVRLYYGVRQPELLLFRCLIEEARSRHPDFHVAYVSESGWPADAAPQPGIVQKTGLLSANLSAADDCDQTKTIYYLSGPPAMLTALSTQLGASGVPSSHIRIDAWS